MSVISAMVASIDDLQLRPVELAQRLLDEPVVFLVGVDQQRVVDRIGGDAHALQQPLPGAAGAATAKLLAGSQAPAPAAPPRPNGPWRLAKVSALPPAMPAPPLPGAAGRPVLSRESAEDPPGCVRAGRCAGRPMRPARIARCRHDAGAGRDLVAGAVERAAARPAAAEDVVEQHGDLSRVAVADVIDLHAGRRYRTCRAG